MLRCTCVRRYLARKNRLVRKRRVANGSSDDREVFFIIIFVFFKYDSAQSQTLKYCCCFYFYSHSDGKRTRSTHTYGVCIRVIVLAPRQTFRIGARRHRNAKRFCAYKQQLAKNFRNIFRVVQRSA